MRVLREGSSGDDVSRIQLLLSAEGHFQGEADGHYRDDTTKAVASFQMAGHFRGTDPKHLGVVDSYTLGPLLQLGLDAVYDADREAPPPPDWLTAVTNHDRRMRDWGRFQWRAIPAEDAPGSPPPKAIGLVGRRFDGIEITDDWEARAIVEVECPATGLMIKLHKNVAPDYARWMHAVVQRGLRDLVLSVDCAYAPRLRRGSRAQLSAHCWGYAVDLNTQWNKPGCTPPYLNEPGSVRALVELANQNHFVWGGHNRRRRDGSHFEHV